MNHRFNANELNAISPDMLRLYAEFVGWEKIGEYGDYSDIYGANDKPEILIARTEKLVDYTDNVSKLIRYFAEDAKKHPLTIFRDLMYALYDVTRVRVISDVIKVRVTREGNSTSFTHAASLMNSMKNLIVSASLFARQSKACPRTRQISSRRKQSTFWSNRNGQPHYAPFNTHPTRTTRLE